MIVFPVLKNANIQIDFPNILPVWAPYWDAGSGSNSSWLYNASETASSTSSESWQEKVSLTFTPPEDAYYLVMSFAQTDHATYAAYVRFSHTVTGEEVIAGGATPQLDTDGHYAPFSTIWYSELNTSTHIFNLTYRSESAAGTVWIRYARIMIWKLSETITEYAASESESSTSSTSWQTKTTLTFNGEGSQWVVIASSEVRTTTSGTFLYQLDDDGDQIAHMGCLSDSTDIRYYPFTVFVTPSRSYTMNFTTQYRSGGAWNSYIARSRIIAIKLADFETTDWSFSSVWSTTNNTSPATELTHDNLQWDSAGNTTLAIMSADYSCDQSAGYTNVEMMVNASGLTSGDVFLQKGYQGYHQNWTTIGGFKVMNTTESDRYYYINFSGAGGPNWVAMRQDTIFTVKLQEEPFSWSSALDGVSIENMEGCGNWVFAEEKYYRFRADFETINESLVDTVGISFLDYNEIHNITAFWEYIDNDVDDSEFSLLIDSEDYVSLSSGAVTFGNISELTTLNVTFEILFKNTILDTLDVDIYQKMNYTDGTDSGWLLVEADYFNIYNLGGHYEEESSDSSRAYRLEGGDAFNLHAKNDSNVQTWLTYRKLQHVKLLSKMNFSYVPYDPYGPFGTYRFEFGFDYCISENDTWITEGFSVLIELEEEYTSTVDGYWYTRWFVSARQRVNASAVVTVAYDYIWAFVDKGNASLPASAGDPFTTDLWVDLWFNTINASTTWGVRVGSYYYGMTNTAHFLWKLVGGGEWSAGWTDSNQALFIGDLYDNDGNIISAQQIVMQKIWARVTRTAGAGVSFETHGEISKLPIFDKTFAPGNIMEGIPTPQFEDTKVPTMPQQAYMGILAGLTYIAGWITDAFGPPMLAFWSVFVAFIDSIFAWLGYPNAFSEFIALLVNAWSWFSSSVGYVVSLLIQGFLFLASGMEKFVSLVVTVVTQFISILQWTWWILDTGFWSTVSLWDQLGMSSWLVIGAIVYPLQLLFLWEEYGFDAMMAEINFFVGSIAFFIKGFLTLISFTSQIIYSLIEIVPLAE